MNYKSWVQRSALKDTKEEGVKETRELGAPLLLGALGNALLEVTVKRRAKGREWRACRDGGRRVQLGGGDAASLTQDQRLMGLDPDGGGAWAQGSWCCWRRRGLRGGRVSKAQIGMEFCLQGSEKSLEGFRQSKNMI